MSQKKKSNRVIKVLHFAIGCSNLTPNEYSFVGVSVNGTKVENMMAYLFLEEKATHKIVKCTIYSVNLQVVLDLFKRFEFQVGKGLDDINENDVEEVEVVE